MWANLQHNAAWHPLSGVAPMAVLKLPKPVSADVCFSLDKLPEVTGLDLLVHPAKLSFATPLKTYGKFNAGIAASLRYFSAFRGRVGDRFVEEDVFSGFDRVPEVLGTEMRRSGQQDHVNHLGRSR